MGKAVNSATNPELYHTTPPKAKFVVWAGGEFQFPASIPNTIRVGCGDRFVVIFVFCSG
jgi:hypothetical protein